MAKATYRLPDNLSDWLKRQAGREQAETGQDVAAQDIVIRAICAEMRRCSELAQKGKEE